MLFRFEDVYKAYGAAEILRGVSFQINPGEKVGLVGRNGAGKTTIFRLLVGKIAPLRPIYGVNLETVEQPDQGQIICASDLSIGLLAQQHRFVQGTTVLETALSIFTRLKQMEARMRALEADMSSLTDAALEKALGEYSDLQHRYELAEGFTAPARAEAVLLGLGFSKEDFSLRVQHLSGGQQSRLSLALLLLGEPDLLLLDEPTNHLDIRAIEWLEEFLNAYRSAYVIISHDRFMLDRCTNHILELDAGRISSYPGNFSFYLAEREARRKVQQQAYEQQQALIERTEDFIRRNIAGQKTKQAKSRRRMLERLERVEAVQGEQTSANFTVKPVARSGDVVLNVEELSVGYTARKLIDGLSFNLYRGEVLAMVGGNGTGKTTLLRTLLGRQLPLGGEIRWGSNVTIGYYDQQLRDLDARNMVIDELRMLEPNAEEVKLRSFLGMFNFRGDDVFKCVGDLSGGEQGRLALARLVYSRVNVLALDEPTNHLDIASREALETALDNYTGTILVVSHDRYFLDRIATKIVYLSGTEAEIFAGTYSEYCDIRRARQEAEQQERATRAAAARSAAKSVSPKPRATRLRDTATIEIEIVQQEEMLHQLSTSLASVEVARSPQRLIQLQKEYEELNQRLEALYQEWEAALERGEGVNG
ncbi:MAG: ABC-F family ATP-binding cassette domain-containing protein [Acidobacteriota bacterium]